MTQLHVQVAEFAMGRAEDVISTLGLGSCVAIALYDRAARVGGLAHVLLPERATSRWTGNAAKFAETAVPLLCEELARIGGGPPARLEARLAGGASMFAALLQSGGLNVGERNVLASRAALSKAGVRVVGEDTGGDYGRSVFFHVADGRVEVRSLRRGTNVI